MYGYQVPVSLGGATLGLTQPINPAVDPLFGRGQMSFQQGINLQGGVASTDTDDRDWETK